MKGVVLALILSLFLSSASWAQGVGFRGTTPNRFVKPRPVVTRPPRGPGFDGVFYQSNRFLIEEAGIGFNGSQPSLFIDQAPTVFPDPQSVEPDPTGF